MSFDQFVRMQNIKHYGSKLLEDIDPYKRAVVRDLLIAEENRTASCTALYEQVCGTIQEARKLREKLKNLPNEVLMGQRIREIDEAISIHQVFLGTIHWELRNGDGKDPQLDLFKNCNL